MLYAPGLPDEDAVRLVCSTLNKPVNCVSGIGSARFTLAQLQYSTLVGGGSTDWSWGLEVHESTSEEIVVVVGVSESSDFPVFDPLLNSAIDLHGDENSGREEACISVLDFASFSTSPQQDPTLRLSSYLGGFGYDGASDVEIDGAGNVHIFGWCDGDLYHGNRVTFPEIVSLT